MRIFETEEWQKIVEEIKARIESARDCMETAHDWIEHQNHVGYVIAMREMLQLPEYFDQDLSVHESNLELVDEEDE